MKIVMALVIGLVYVAICLYFMACQAIQLVELARCREYRWTMVAIYFIVVFLVLLMAIAGLLHFL